MRAYGSLAAGIFSLNQSSPLLQRRHHFPDRVEGAFGGFGAERDRLAGAVEVEEADAAEARTDGHVGRVAGETRPGDAILHDVERFHHDGGETRAAVAAEELALDRLLGREHAAQPALRFWRVAGEIVAVVGAMAGNGRATADQVGVEVDRHDDARSERTRGGDRNGID